MSSSALSPYLSWHFECVRSYTRMQRFSKPVRGYSQVDITLLNRSSMYTLLHRLTCARTRPHGPSTAAHSHARVELPCSSRICPAPLAQNLWCRCKQSSHTSCLASGVTRHEEQCSQGTSASASSLARCVCNWPGAAHSNDKGQQQKYWSTHVCARTQEFGVIAVLRDTV